MQCNYKVALHYNNYQMTIVHYLKCELNLPRPVVDDCLGLTFDAMQKLWFTCSYYPISNVLVAARILSS